MRSSSAAVLPPGTAVGWQPHPGPQTSFVLCPVEDVLFGGARGGGKTEALLGDWLIRADRYGSGSRGIVFRKTYPQLEEVEAVTLALFPKFGALYNVQRHSWRFVNGATLKLRYLENDRDADEYQGHSYTWVAFDELTNWPSPVPVDKLRACLRSTQRVPCVLRATGNPGGVGHNWVKARYIDPAPAYQPHYAKNDSGDGGTWRVFIPSTLDDNPSLAADAGYWQRVEAAAAGNQALLKAWRYGDWNVIAGGYFDDLWSQSRHVVEPFPIPAGWRVDRSFDWGSTKPYACLWFAESNAEEVVLRDGRRRSWPRGTLFVIGEEYGWNGKPNEGLRLANTEIARRIMAAEEQLGVKGRVQPGPADNQIFDVINGTSIADEMARVGLRWTRSNKGKGSRVTGWQAIRGLLQAARQQPMEAPGLFVFATCRNTIRTLPVMPRDQRKPDDVDTEAEDHLCDAIRYRCLAQRHEVEEREILGI
jgi:hypothetical protein